MALRGKTSTRRGYAPAGKKLEPLDVPEATPEKKPKKPRKKRTLFGKKTK